MNIYLIRHGQTELNQNRVHQYSTTPLSKRGLEEASYLAERLKKVKIDQIYSSPMKRAEQTAKIISEKIGINYKILENLKELKRPSVIEGKSVTDQIAVQIKKSIRDNYHLPHWHHSDEENFWDIKNRISNLMKFLENQSAGNILLVTHGIAIKMFVFLAIFKDKLTPEQFLAIYEHVRTSNTGISHCYFSRESGWEIISLNDTTHLG